MARLTTVRPSGARQLALVGAALVVALMALGAIRIALGGWAPLAADDARYLYVGLSILDGHGPVGPSGTVFLLRSPIYGLALALGSPLGSDPLAGARVVATTLSLLGLAGACRLGWRLAGPGGAIGTAVALVSIPLVWHLIPSLAHRPHADRRDRRRVARRLQAHDPSLGDRRRPRRPGDPRQGDHRTDPHPPGRAAWVRSETVPPLGSP